MFRCSHTIIKERITRARVNFNVNFKTVFKTIHLSISW
jgi:hypothetical protein